MRFGLFIIGAEILSGKRQDKHLSKVIQLLAARGLALSWAQVLGDDENLLAQAFHASRVPDTVVLSCGGIGATPDDKTRQAAAQAFRLPLVRHPEAERLIVDQYGDIARPNRVLMADFPKGAGIIPNPVNRVAGFFVEDHNFVPGFPEMAWPMLEWVLDTRYAHLRNPNPPVEFSLRALGTSAEGDLLHLMEGVLAEFPSVEFSSLPSRGDAQRPRHIEFGFKGKPDLAANAYRWFLERIVKEPGVTIEPIRTP
jgi:molybdopterin-biosynthesis enzyme MoeA-like protein